MKKIPFFAPFIIALVILPYLSCKSAPKVETTPKPVQQPGASGRANQPVDPALNAAIARAEEARKRAVDFNSSAYFPSEWEDAEAQYAQAKQIPTDADLVNHAAITKNNPGDGVDEAISVYNAAAGTGKAIDAYNAAADAYDAVFKRAIPLYAQAREDEIVALRDNLVAVGWKDVLPNYLSAADKVALTALSQYEAEDYYAARDSADQALMMYQTMTAAYNAMMAANEIEERDFVVYDPDNYERAGEVLEKAIDDYDAENYASAYENANEALNRYNLVLSAGWAAHAEKYAELAGTARQAALDIKADVAVRNDFSKADSIYKTAVSAFDAQKYGDAAKQFYESEGLFNAAAKSTLEKRGIAQKTIEQANKKIEESDETARLAELILEGGAE